MRNFPDGNRIRFQMAMGRAIARHREASGMSQAQLGKAIGVSSSHVHKMEDGTVPPTSWAIYQLAHVFDCTTDDLLVDAVDEAAA